MIAIEQLNPEQLEQLIHAETGGKEKKEQDAKVLALRDYVKGVHPSMLTNRQEQIIGSLLQGNAFPGWAFNLAGTIVKTYTKRLNCTGLTMEGVKDDDTTSPEAVVGQDMWKWWTRSRLDSQQARIYRRALRDGKTYVMVDFDADKQRPRFTLHKLDAGEKEPGIVLRRDPSDENKVLYATRYFVSIDPLEPDAEPIKRKTVYLPNQIRKYKQGKDGKWEPYMDAGDGSWPLPWTDRNGNPIGLPVIEFAPADGSCLTQIIPLQNAINKACLDLIGAADASGFRMLGVEYDSTRLGPRTGGAQSDADDTGDDEVRVSPFRLMEVDDGSIVQIEPGDLMQLIAMVNWLLQSISGMANIPIYYLRPVGGSEVPSGESLKQLESALVAFIQELQLIFGQAWEDVFGIAYVVNQAFGPTLPDLVEPSIRMQWQDANVRNELAEAQTAEAHQRLGVPQPTLWRMLGYTPEEIEAFQAAQAQVQQQQVATIAAAMRTQGTQGAQAQGGNNGRTNPAVG